MLETEGRLHQGQGQTRDQAQIVQSELQQYFAHGSSRTYLQEPSNPCHPQLQLQQHQQQQIPHQYQLHSQQLQQQHQQHQQQQQQQQQHQQHQQHQQKRQQQQQAEYTPTPDDAYALFLATTDPCRRRFPVSGPLLRCNGKTVVSPQFTAIGVSLEQKILEWMVYRLDVGAPVQDKELNESLNLIDLHHRKRLALAHEWRQTGVLAQAPVVSSNDPFQAQTARQAQLSAQPLVQNPCVSLPSPSTLTSANTARSSSRSQIARLSGSSSVSAAKLPAPRSSTATKQTKTSSSKVAKPIPREIIVISPEPEEIPSLISSDVTLNIAAQDAPIRNLNAGHDNWDMEQRLIRQVREQSAALSHAARSVAESPHVAQSAHVANELASAKDERPQSFSSRKRWTPSSSDATDRSEQYRQDVPRSGKSTATGKSNARVIAPISNRRPSTHSRWNPSGESDCGSRSSSILYSNFCSPVHVVLPQRGRPHIVQSPSPDLGRMPTPPPLTDYQQKPWRAVDRQTAKLAAARHVEELQTMAQEREQSRNTNQEASTEKSEAELARQVQRARDRRNHLQLLSYPPDTDDEPGCPPNLQLMTQRVAAPLFVPEDADEDNISCPTLKVEEIRPEPEEPTEMNEVLDNIRDKHKNNSTLSLDGSSGSVSINDAFHQDLRDSTNYAGYGQQELQRIFKKAKNSASAALTSHLNDLMALSGALFEADIDLGHADLQTHDDKEMPQHIGQEQCPSNLSYVSKGNLFTVLTTKISDLQKEMDRLQGMPDATNFVLAPDYLALADGLCNNQSAATYLSTIPDLSAHMAHPSDIVLSNQYLQSDFEMETVLPSPYTSSGDMTTAPAMAAANLQFSGIGSNYDYPADYFSKHYNFEPPTHTMNDSHGTPPLTVPPSYSCFSNCNGVVGGISGLGTVGGGMQSVPPTLESMHSQNYNHNQGVTSTTRAMSSNAYANTNSSTNVNVMFSRDPCGQETEMGVQQWWQLQTRSPCATGNSDAPVSDPFTTTASTSALKPPVNMMW